MVSLPAEAPAPRLCEIRKTYPEQEYGFNLHAERGKGQFIGQVDPDTPADAAGLKAGDRIVAVNSHLIQQDSHKQVVARIKENPLACTLLVIEEEGELWYRSRNLAISLDQANIRRGRAPAEEQSKQEHPASNHPPPPSLSRSHQQQPQQQQLQQEQEEQPPTPMSPPSSEEANQSADSANVSVSPPRDLSLAEPPEILPRPRLCVLAKQSPGDEYGFNLHADRNKGHFIGGVDANSLAEASGLEEGQRIVGVNGVLIYPTSPHKDVVALIKQEPFRAQLLVASHEVDAFYREHGRAYAFGDAEIARRDGGRLASSPLLNGNHLHQSNGHHHQPLNGNGHRGLSQVEETESLGSDAAKPQSPSPPPSPPLSKPVLGEVQRLHKTSESRSSASSQHSGLGSQSQPQSQLHSAQRRDTSPGSSSGLSSSLSSPQPVYTAPPPPEPPRATFPAQPPPPGADEALNDVFGLSAKELRAKLARNKRASGEPIKSSGLSIQEKYDIVRNL